MMKKALFLLTLFLFLNVYPSAYGIDLPSSRQISYTSYMAVFSKSTDRFIRKSDGHLDDLGPDEYISFVVDVENNLRSKSQSVTGYIRVDAGENLAWASHSIEPGKKVSFHTPYAYMQKLAPGSHKVNFYLNDAFVHSRDFYLTRAWKSLMSYPTTSQINAVSGKARSPFISFYPQFPGVTGLTEYSIDFWVDDIDDDTYFSTMDWDMDVSYLESRYTSVYNDYNTPGGVYCGLQRWENGKTGVIMTVWDVFARDSSGNVTVYCASELYPEVKKCSPSTPHAEGSTHGFIREYDWEPGHPYRMLMQQTVSEETGNTVLTMWICDLIWNRWDKIVSFDLGYRSNYMKTYGLAGFLENYGTPWAGSVRNVSFSNIRGMDNLSGRWVAAKSVSFQTNNTISALDYMGSYNFGSDDSTFWIITSGVPGLCYGPSSGSTFSVRNASTESPR